MCIDVDILLMIYETHNTQLLLVSYYYIFIFILAELKVEMKQE